MLLKTYSINANFFLFLNFYILKRVLAIISLLRFNKYIINQTVKILKCIKQTLHIPIFLCCKFFLYFLLYLSYYMLKEKNIHKYRL